MHVTHFDIEQWRQKFIYAILPPLEYSPFEIHLSALYLYESNENISINAYRYRGTIFLCVGIKHLHIYPLKFYNRVNT